MMETGLFAPPHRHYGLATQRYPVLEVTPSTEPSRTDGAFRGGQFGRGNRVTSPASTRPTRGLEVGSGASNLKRDRNRSGCALGPVPPMTVGVKQFPGTVSPFLILRTAEGFFETLRRNFDDAQPALRSREFDHRLSLDRREARAKPTRRAFQKCNNRTGTLAFAVEKGDEVLQQFGQVIPGANLEWNRSDGSNNERIASTLGFRNNYYGLGGV